MRVYLLVLLTALAVTLILTPVVRRLALSLNILTPLRARDVHAHPIPRLGGLAMTGGILAAFVLGYSIPYLRPIYDSSPTLWSVALGAIAIALLGAVDDIWELDWLTKLTGQILIAGGMAIGGVQLISIPIFGVTVGSAWLSVLVSTLILVAIINAVNFVDGLDGLAAGVIAIGSLSFFAYSYTLTRLMGATSYATAAAVVTVALAGACIAFLWFNWHPASIFMGDSGAMVLGLMLGSATIIVTGQVNPGLLAEQSVVTPWVPVILPLAVLLIPISDLVITPLLRMVHGKSPMTADRTHLHDRLLQHGHSHRGVVLILYAWTTWACVVAVSFVLLPAVIVLAWAIPLAVLVILATAFQFPGSSRSRRRVRGAGVPGGTVATDDGQTVIARPNLDSRWLPLAPGRQDERRKE
ncbi:MraY family glycosyltransferase [Actinomyces minihominis]|uniref:MraY family glycosyltransferase n=1 Tax=Actinomyces minihominis TaxID=2002838 RepID=UPI000C088B8F|nr:MraY family glycosyltransferase [Actinomyces minihominis]